MYVGIDVGGTNIKYGLVDEKGKILSAASSKTQMDKEGIISQLVEIILEFKETTPELRGVGISMPGVIRKDGFLVSAGAIKSLFGVHLREILEAKTGLMIVIENDANSAALAEQWIGSAQKMANYLTVVLGTGVGGGIVINDAIYRGAHGMAGEFGWMVVDTNYENQNIETASLNQRGAVVGGLLNQYNLAAKAENQAMLEDAKEVFVKEMEGDELAKKIIERFIEDIGIGLLNLASVFDPEMIFIGGAISTNTSFVERLYKKYDELISYHPSIFEFEKKGMFPKLCTSSLNNHAGFVGAVYQVHRSMGVKNGNE